MKIEKLLKTITLTTGALCLIGSLANGADLSQRGAISFDIYDLNKDGYISENEFYDIRGKRQSLKANQGMPMRNAGNAPDFNLFDTNNDGKLTKLELLKAQNTQIKSNRSNQGNMNKGQRGSKQGKGQGRMNIPTFENFDLNNDGYLTKKEMAEARGNRSGRYSTPFSDIDTNNDGQVSKDEFLVNQSKKRK